MRAALFGLWLLAAPALAESPYTAPDKVGHYAGGATLTAVGSIFVSPEIGLAGALFVNAAKEWYDDKNPDKGHYERADFGAAALGAVLVYAALKTEKLRLTTTERGTPVLSYQWRMR